MDTSQYIYTRVDHINHKLKKLQQTEPKMPLEVLHFVETELKRNQLEITTANIKLILGRNKLLQYYEEIPACIRVLTNKLETCTKINLVASVECIITNEERKQIVDYYQQNQNKYAKSRSFDSIIQEIAAELNIDMPCI